MIDKRLISNFWTPKDLEPRLNMPVPVNKDKDEMIKMAIAMSLEGQSRVNENEHEENVGKSYYNVKYDK